MPTQWTCVNTDNELATDDPGECILAWNNPANARQAVKNQPGKWSVIKLGSRRYHRAIAQQFGIRARPRHAWQDQPHEK